MCLSTGPRQSLLTDHTHATCAHQHCGTDVKLLLELCDEDVNTDKIVVIVLLHLADDVGHPLKLPLGACHPQEIHLVVTNTTNVNKNTCNNCKRACMRVHHSLSIANTLAF